MTLEDFDRMVEEQQGKCLICRQAPEDTNELQVDHDHATEEIRGLLCHKCNKALGLLGDDPATIRRAATYLERGNEATW